METRFRGSQPVRMTPNRKTALLNRNHAVSSNTQRPYNSPVAAQEIKKLKSEGKIQKQPRPTRGQHAITASLQLECPVPPPGANIKPEEWEMRKAAMVYVNNDELSPPDLFAGFKIPAAIVQAVREAQGVGTNSKECNCPIRGGNRVCLVFTSFWCSFCSASTNLTKFCSVASCFLQSTHVVMARHFCVYAILAAVKDSQASKNSAKKTEYSTSKVVRFVLKMVCSPEEVCSMSLDRHKSDRAFFSTVYVSDFYRKRCICSINVFRRLFAKHAFLPHDI